MCLVLPSAVWIQKNKERQLNIPYRNFVPDWIVATLFGKN